MKSTQPKPRPRHKVESRARSWLGEDSKLEIVQKVATIFALVFGVWAYLDTLHPVFEKERELREAQLKIEGLQLSGLEMRLQLADLKEMISETQAERLRMQDEYESYRTEVQATARGIILGQLLTIKQRLQGEAESYRREGIAVDLNAAATALLQREADRLGAAPDGSIRDQRSRALDLFRSFVEAEIPVGSRNPQLFDRLLPYLEQQDFFSDRN